MRLFFTFIVIFDILVLGAGLFFIIDRIVLKAKSKRHYVFHPFEEENKEGYILEDDEKNNIFSAEQIGDDGNCAIFRFKNGKNKSSNTYKVSGPGHNPNAPNFTNISFLFDDVDVWNVLREFNIHIETTIVNESLTLYKISKRSKPIAFARKKDEQTVYTMKSNEKNIELIFITLFAIAKSEEFFRVIQELNKNQ